MVYPAPLLKGFIQHHFSNKKNGAGFTLIELMIVISIVGVLSLVVMFNYSTFNDRLALSSAGQEMAIAVRQAQVYGLNVRESSSGNFTSAFGVFIDPVSSPSTYYIFADKDGNDLYDVGNGCGTALTECVEAIAIRNGVRITSINTLLGCIGNRSLHITFLRPNPDAIITFANLGGNSVCLLQPNAQIVLTSPKNSTLTVNVESTGQVLAQ